VPPGPGYGYARVDYTTLRRRGHDNRARVGNAVAVNSTRERLARVVRWRPEPRQRRLLQAGVALVVVAAAVFTLGGRLPDPAEVLGVLRTLDYTWVAVCVGLLLLSKIAFAEQQRLLLAGYGARMPMTSAYSLVMAGSAISMAMPAGAALSAAFTFRVYRRFASGTIAGSVTLLSNLVATAGLILLYALASLTSLADIARRHPIALAATSAALLGAVLGGVALRQARKAGRLRWLDRPMLAPLMRALRETRSVPVRYWAGGLASSLIAWAVDLLLLVAAANTVYEGLGWWRLALIYLGVQIVRQIPITPGGIGLIEASMLAALVAAGAPHPAAAAIVLIYRLVSFWLILPLGLAGWVRLRREAAVAGEPDKPLIPRQAAPDDSRQNV
jgi:putative heme transporter